MDDPLAPDNVRETQHFLQRHAYLLRKIEADRVLLGHRKAQAVSMISKGFTLDQAAEQTSYAVNTISKLINDNGPGQRLLSLHYAMQAVKGGEDLDYIRGLAMAAVKDNIDPDPRVAVQLMKTAIEIHPEYHTLKNGRLLSHDTTRDVKMPACLEDQGNLERILAGEKPVLTHA